MLLRVEDLKVHFFTDEGVVKAVDGLSYDLERGKTLCLVGESGSGKSVSARALLQLIGRPGKIVNGRIFYYPEPEEGGKSKPVDIAALSPKSREVRTIRGNEISMIFQEPMRSFSPSYTVGNQIIENIRLHDNVSKAEARNRAIELLRRVGIPKPETRVDAYPFRLSGGMLQRCMIAMALSCNPKLLIADEPTTALDVTTQAQILDLMRELQEIYNMAILFITHDLGVVAEIADDVAVMYLGKIVEYSDVVTVFNQPKHPYTRALLRSIPKVAARRTRLDPIEGMVPSPFERPTGCLFHPRCTRAVMGICNEVVPPMIPVNDHQEARCLIYHADYADAFSEKTPDNPPTEEQHHA
ncbi:ABC transporter ATP-binding protein [Phototrophicus methaneseepsis]